MTAPTEAPVLLVASPGGHVEELRLLAPELGIDPGNVHWVTSRTAQTESLLKDQVVTWFPPIVSGDRARVVQALPAAFRLQRRLRPQLVVSTGAAAASPHLLAAAARGCPVWFIESATRLIGPSQTGRLAQRLPRTRLFVQGEGWGDPRWEQIAGIFDAFVVTPRPAGGSGPSRAVVSLGTERFPFHRAVARTQGVLEGCDIFWQTGSTLTERRGVRLEQWVSPDRLHTACADADVVIVHGGVGSALMALRAGKVPIILPRRADKGEHIDDHQRQVSELLVSRGLAISVDPDELSWDHVVRAYNLVARPRNPEDFASDHCGVARA